MGRRPTPSTQCGPKAHTLCSPSLSEARGGHSVTQVIHLRPTPKVKVCPLIEVWLKIAKMASDLRRRAWKGAEGDDDVPDELYLFHETICAGVRVIDQSFGVDHINDLWPAEDEKWDKERLWGRPEDDSKTNTDSEAEDALESHAGVRVSGRPPPGFLSRSAR